MATTDSSRSWLSTSNVPLWGQLVATTLAVLVIVSYFGAVHRPARHYLSAAFVVFWISLIWYRCWSEVKKLERQHKDESDATIGLLWAVCWQLSLLQMIVANAVTPLPR